MYAIPNPTVPEEISVNQLEINIRLKQSEIKILQNELETLYQMIKQLENQKLEAKKRLDDMSNQVGLFVIDLTYL